MGQIESPGSAVFLTYLPTQSPTEQPVRVRLPLIQDGIAEAYRINLGDGFSTSIELAEDGQVVYELESLADVIDRMNVLRAEAFVNGGDLSIEDAAMRIAREDGHVAT